LQTGASANAIVVRPDPFFDKPSESQPPRDSASHALGIATIDYVYLPRFVSAIGPDASGLADPRITDVSHLRDLGLFLARVLLTVERLLPQLRVDETMRDAVFTKGDELRGKTVLFEGQFRTKNMPDVSTWEDRDWRSWNPSQHAEKAPHIYLRKGLRTVRIMVDPRYLTTTSAHARFLSASGGRAHVGGVGIVTSVSDAGDLAVITPLVMGVPTP